MANFSELLKETESAAVIPEISEGPKTPPSDLSALLADYKEAAKVIETPNPAPATAPPVQTENVKYPGMPSWYGNPLYYQSGKKQGQIKPPPKNGSFRQAIQQPVNATVNPETSIISGDIISGALLLTIINLLMPMALSLTHNLLVKDKKKRIDYEHLQIPDNELKKIDKLADAALKHIKIEANPVGFLIFALIGLYAMQFMTVKLMTDIHTKKETK